MKKIFKDVSILAPEINAAVCFADKNLDIDYYTITAFVSELSEGGKQDFFSTGDYWWPDEKRQNGLPYIRKDGHTNPNGFYEHRHVLRAMRKDLCANVLAYLSTKEEKYSTRACGLLDTFFVQEESRMNSNLSYAQAIPGICSGRGIGIIDTLHLVEVPMAIEHLFQEGGMSRSLYDSLKKWFSDYLDWILHSEYGKDEHYNGNNHTTAWAVQAAAFALFVGDQNTIDLLRKEYPEYLNDQMAEDGSFPLELERTKPYNYSLFNLDCFAALAYLLSDENCDMMVVESNKGVSLLDSIEFHYPFIKDKSTWPYHTDIAHFDDLPGRRSALFLYALSQNNSSYLETWKNCPAEVDDEEIRRNQLMRQALLWLDPSSSDFRLDK